MNITVVESGYFYEDRMVKKHIDLYTEMPKLSDVIPDGYIEESHREYGLDYEDLIYIQQNLYKHIYRKKVK